MRVLLVNLLRESGDLDRAVHHAEILVEQQPRSFGMRELLQRLLAERDGN